MIVVAKCLWLVPPDVGPPQADLSEGESLTSIRQKTPDLRTVTKHRFYDIVDNESSLVAGIS